MTSTNPPQRGADRRNPMSTNEVEENFEDKKDESCVGSKMLLEFYDVLIHF